MRSAEHLNYWLDIRDEAEARKKIITDCEFNKTTDEDAERIRKALDIKDTDVVLDYGCGIGRLMKPISDICHTIIGLDISETMIMYGIKYCKGHHNCIFKPMQSVAAIPLKESCADKIYSHIVLQHMERADAFKALSEMARCLKMSGKIYLQYPDIHQEAYVYHQVQRHQGGLISPLLKFYTKDELEMIFEKIRLKIIKIEKKGCDWFVLAEKSEPTLLFGEILYSTKVKDDE